MQSFTAIIQNENLPSLMAVDRSTGTLFINPQRFDAATPETRKFFLLHELGHLRLDSPDEQAADAEAFTAFVGQSPQNVAKAVQILRNEIGTKAMTDPDAEARINALVRRAILYQSINGNTKATNVLLYLNKESISGSFFDSVGDFFGGIVDTVGDIGSSVFDTVGDVVGGVGDFAGSLIGGVGDVAGGLIGGVGGMAGNLLGGLTGSGQKQTTTTAQQQYAAQQQQYAAQQQQYAAQQQSAASSNNTILIVAGVGIMMFMMMFMMMGNKKI